MYGFAAGAGCSTDPKKALEVRASGERNESFALGKRFFVAKLTASLSP